MKNSKMNNELTTLKEKGFKKIKRLKSHYINKKGVVYNFETKKYLYPKNANYIKLEGKMLNGAKLVLQAFAKEPYRKTRVKFIDGNNNNISLENVKYSRLYLPMEVLKVNPKELIAAIRCYCWVKKDFNINNHSVLNSYLRHIISKRAFITEHYKKPHIEIFREYIFHGITGISKDNLCIKYDLHYEDCNKVVDYFTNLLVSDIKQDVSKGLLKVKDYYKEYKNTKEAIKSYIESTKEILKKGDKYQKIDNAKNRKN